MVVVVSCRGFESSGIQVPPFELALGEFVALALPIDFGVAWVEVMRSWLDNPDAGVATFCSVHVVAPESLRHECDMLPSRDEGRSLAPASMASRLIADVDRVCTGDNTITVTSTAGLDPNGIQRFVTELRAAANSRTVIDFVSVSLSEYYDSTGLYDRVVCCRRKR